MAEKVHAVGVIFEDQEGRILVLRRHAAQPEGQTWGLVGGKIQTGQTAASTAVLKVGVEIGQRIDTGRLSLVETYRWKRDDLDLTFEVFKLDVSSHNIAIRLDPEASTEYAWLRPDDLILRHDLMEGLYPILQDLYGVKGF